MTHNFMHVFKESLAKIQGVACWSVVAGKGTGSVINIGFGGKIKRDKPLLNRTLGEEERHFEAEYSLLVYCAWRLSHNGSVQCSWRDDNGHDGPMLKGLSLLKSSKLTAAQFEADSFDLTFMFENGLRLDIFCDHSDPDEAEQNYILYTPQKAFIVGVPSQLVVEERKPHRLVLLV